MLDNDKQRIFLSFGAGIQSTALLGMCTLKMHDFPMPEYAVFADVGDEPAWVYETVDFMREWCKKNNGPEVITVSTGGKLSDSFAESASRYIAIPAFMEGDDGYPMMGRRQCTREFKIEPIVKKYRELLGYKPGQRVPTGFFVQLIGISYDEMRRCKQNERTKWIENRWPLVDAGLWRDDCFKFCIEVLKHTPHRSSCNFCPYHSDLFWRKLKEHAPEEFQRAVEADRALRKIHLLPGTKWERPQYLHRSLQPLEEVDFTDNQMELFGQECEGMCGN